MDGKQSSAAQNGRASEDHREGRDRGPLTLAQPGTGSFPGFFGKHRLQAAITHLNNQITIMQVNALLPLSHIS